MRLALRNPKYVLHRLHSCYSYEVCLELPKWQENHARGGERVALRLLVAIIAQQSVTVPPWHQTDGDI